MTGKETETEKKLRRINNNKIVAWVVVVAVVVTAVLTFFGVVDDFLKRIFPPASNAASAPAALPPAERIFAHCQMGVLPSLVPPEGRIYVLLAMELPASSGGGGLGEYFGTPGSKWGWGESPAWAYRCELTNYAPDVLFNVSIPVHLTFRTPMPVPGQPNSLSEGAITLDRDWVITVPKLDPSPAAPYVFYIRNSQVRRFIQVRLPDFASVGNNKIPIVQSQGNLLQGLNPEPFK